MDLVDLIAEKSFIGQDFLTWLFWQADRRGTVTANGRTIGITFNGKATLESGEGMNLEKVTCSGNAEMQEAMKALSLGKKIESATIVLVVDDLESRFTISGSLMEFKSVKLPRTGTAVEAEGIEGFILDRIYLVEALQETMEDILSEFIFRRANAFLWFEDLTGIRDWIQERNGLQILN